MSYMNDWIAFALGVSFLCGGLVAGRRLGVVAAWWLAGGAWLAFRFADVVWKPVVINLRAGSPDMDLASGIPLTYGLLFAAVLTPTLVFLVCVRPKKDFGLPGKIELPLGLLGGMVAGVVLLLALAQSHIMHPVIKERMPLTIRIAGPVLGALGQQNIGVPAPAPAAPAKKGG
jgi:hypothetical protein